MFERIDPLKLADNPFKLIGEDWMIISAKGKEKSSGMTASWGGVGILYNKPVCFCFVRPQRYTYKLVENTDYVTFSFFDESYKKVLGYFGRASGYNEDKIAESGLCAITENEYVWYDEARLVIKARKIYADDIKENCFIDTTKLEHYPSKDYHRVYICEIEEVLIKR